MEGNQQQRKQHQPDLYVEHGQQAVLNVYQILLICHDLCQVFVRLQQHPVISVHLCRRSRTYVTQQMCPKQQCRGLPQSCRLHSAIPEGLRHAHLRLCHTRCQPWLTRNQSAGAWHMSAFRQREPQQLQDQELVLATSPVMHLESKSID